MIKYATINKDSIMGKEMLHQSNGILGKELSRRNLFKGAVRGAIGVAAIGAVKKIERDGIGIRLNPPDFEQEPFNPSYQEIVPVELAQSTPINIAAPIETTQRIYNQTGIEYFENNPDIPLKHRTNSIKDIDRAYEEGARMLDVDANIAGGTIWAEHGHVFTLFGRPIIVFDINEGEVKLGGRPNTLQEVIGHIQTKEEQCAVEIECKRGKYTRANFEHLIDIVGTTPSVIKVHSFEELALVENIAKKRNAEYIKVEIAPRTI